MVTSFASNIRLPYQSSILQFLQKYTFGVLAVAASLLMMATCIACNKKQYDQFMETENNNGGDTTKTKRILALGDSYTIGQNVVEADRFPNQTIKLLQDKGIGLKYPAEIIAVTGWTTANLLNGIQTANPKPSPPYDAVTLLIGVNNQYQGRDTAEYRNEFIQCLNKAIFFSGNLTNKVFVLSIPDWGVTPFAAGQDRAAIAAKIDQFNAINKQVCQQMNIVYIDITPSTRQAATDPTLVANDGLHPSGKEYAKWAALLANEMIKVLK